MTLLQAISLLQNKNNNYDIKKKLLLSAILLPVFFFCAGQNTIYVSTKGNDNNPGSLLKPFRTLRAAISNSIHLTRKDVSIEMRGGTDSLQKKYR